MSEHRSWSGFSSLVWVVMFFFLVTAMGCGGRAANPIMVTQFGDRKKSCEALELEMSQVQQQITMLIPETDKTGANVILGIAGAFVLFPWFFMDFTESEWIEVNALRQRYNHLGLIAMDRDCSGNFKQLEMPKPPKYDEDDDE